MPNAIAYNALISACWESKQPERALNIFEALAQQSVVPNVIKYSALISVCEKGKQSVRALLVSEVLVQQGMVVQRL